jgi:hypothetical protein
MEQELIPKCAILVMRQFPSWVKCMSVKRQHRWKVLTADSFLVMEDTFQNGIDPAYWSYEVRTAGYGSVLSFSHSTQWGHNADN